MNQKLSISNKHNELPENLAEVPKDILSTIHQSLQKPIRSYPDKEELQVLLGMEIMKLAESYGTYEEISDPVLEECNVFVMSEFGMLGIEELNQAFRMATSGRLFNVDFKIYRGHFNVKILGTVLRAYRNYRQKVVAELVHHQSKLSEMDIEERQKMKKRMAFDASFPGIVEKAKTTKKYDSWHSVPVFWYNAAQRLGLLQLDKAEKEVIWKEAMPLAIQDLKLNTMQLQQRHQKHCQQLLKNLEEGIIDQSHVQLVARKLAVWKKTIEPCIKRRTRHLNHAT